MHIGPRIREIRESKGLGYSQLAEATGLDLRYLKRLEKGTVKSPSWDAVCKIADALGVSIQSFRNNAESSTPSA